MKNKSALFIAQAGIVAALYVVLTLLSNAFGLASGVIQVRISEALCILPCFIASAVPGLFIGCFLSNILAGGVIWDVIFGSIATLLGAIGTRLLKKHRYLASLPPIIANMLIVPFVLRYAYHIEGAIWYFMLTVGAGELISCGILGQALYTALKNTGIFKEEVKE